MSGLHMLNVTKKFGDFIAVDDISLNVAAGEVLCLLGPSGCGKTTTLRMIAGLESTSAGEIRFNDKVVTQDSARKRNVAMAFQFYALYPNLTVGENLVYPLHAEGLDTDAITQKQQDIAEILQLDTVLHRYPHQLSEGEKQRVAVGRCVIRNPETFLFDEPLSRLDVKLREEMRGDIRQVLARLDKPTVIVTHDQLEAMTMGDKIAVMREGRIEQVGPQQDLFDRPSNTFVASFLGTPQMNVVDGIVIDVGTTSFTFEMGGRRVDLPLRQWSQMPVVGAALTVGFRPRAVLVAENKPTMADTVAEMNEPMGAETLTHLRCGDVLLRMILDHAKAPHVGDKVSLKINAADLHLFDEQGDRVELQKEQGASNDR